MVDTFENEIGRLPNLTDLLCLVIVGQSLFEGKRSIAFEQQPLGLNNEVPQTAVPQMAT